MAKNTIFETEHERFRRERAENVEKEYMQYSTEILGKQVSPNRVMAHLADRFDMSKEGIKIILKRAGIYISAKKPLKIKKKPNRTHSAPVQPTLFLIQ